MHLRKLLYLFGMILGALSFSYAQTEQVRNGDFSNGSSNWNLGRYGGSSSGSVTGGTYRIDVSSAGSEHWHVQFTQTGITLVKGQAYLFSFDAYKGNMNSGTQTMQVNIGQSGSPYTSYFGNRNQIVTLSGTKTRYSFTIAMTHTSDYNARIEFNCGKSTGNFYLDNISFIEQTSAVSKLTASPGTVDFGTVAPSGSYTSDITLQNSGNATTTVNSVQSSSGVFSAAITTPATVAAGGTLTLPVTCAPQTGDVLTGDITIKSNASDNPTLKVACRAQFGGQPDYVISVGATLGGTVKPKGNTTVAAHSSLTVTITPDADRKIIEVMVDGKPVGPVTTYTFTNITADHSVVVTFGPIPEYTITTGGTVGGTVKPSGATVVKEHSSLTCTITPSSGYRIVEVLVDGVPEGPITSYTFSDITNDHTVVVTFVKDNSHTITATASSGGTISPSGAVKVSDNGQQNFIFTPKSGYNISSVKVDGKTVPVSTSYKFTAVTSDHTISVGFTPKTYTITASAGSGGSISPSGAVTVSHGSSQTFTIKPQSGYEISGLSVDGSPVSPAASYTFSSLSASHSVAASFSVSSPVVCQINCGSNSAATPFSDDRFVNGGIMRTISDGITINGISKPAPEKVYQSERYGNSTYTITGLTSGADYMVRLHFAELYWTSSGKRVFDVVINGTTVLSNFDLYSVTGARYKAALREFQTNADGSGRITIDFITKTDNATIEGIEILETAPNNRPTVKNPASASPDQVAGISSKLSVLGDDDSGEDKLTYTWEAIGGSPATAVFSRNGTNDAKNCTATFSRSGTYTLRATITDQGNKSVTSSVTVTVTQTPTTIAVSPKNVSVPVNTTQQFYAMVRDQFGIDMTSGSTVTWTTNGGGSIGTNGLFTAQNRVGGPYTVTAKCNSLKATAAVSVGNKPVAVYQINCGNYNGYTPYSGDQFGSGGVMRTVQDNITIGNVTDPAPQHVYRSERYGNSTYTIPGLLQGDTYIVRLHFAELYWTSSGKRRFNVQVNGATKMSDYDPFAETGARYKAVVHEFPTTADGNGRIVIRFITITDNATIEGIEILH